MKNYSDTIGNRTRDIPYCSALPQPAAPPRAPYFYVYRRSNRTQHSSLHDIRYLIGDDTEATPPHSGDKRLSTATHDFQPRHTTLSRDTRISAATHDSQPRHTTLSRDTRNTIRTMHFVSKHVGQDTNKQVHITVTSVRSQKVFLWSYFSVYARA